ncbi:hypothetical protein AB6813_07975 [bacterium RCC_150]
MEKLEVPTPQQNPTQQLNPTQQQNLTDHKIPEQTLQADVEFHVSYFEAESGRVRLEVFFEQAAAERFANAQLTDQDSWAVVDVVTIEGEQKLVA